jgi:hypothetical protein
MILALAAAVYRAMQAVGYFPDDVVLFPFLVLVAWILFLYWLFTSPVFVRYYEQAYSKWARERRFLGYFTVISMGVVIGGTTGAAWWKLCEIHSEHMRALSNKSAPLPQVAKKADLKMVLVNSKHPGIILLSTNQPARDVRADPLLWDIDRADRSLDSLDDNVAKYDWIRTDQHGGPTSLLHPDDVRKIVKPGHRIFGYITVACPECERGRVYWVYFTYGAGGWFTERLGPKYPLPKEVVDIVSRMRADGPDVFLNTIPPTSRIPIQPED